MRRKVTGVIAVTLALALVLALVIVGVRWWQHGHRSEFMVALDAAPAGAERLSWTDWADVRRSLDSDVDASSGPDELGAFLDAGFEADLTSRSALVQSAPTLQSSYGFSPATAEWELFSQSREGALITLRLPDGTDFDALGERLAGLGYQRPQDETGVWAGGFDLLAMLSPELTPELAYLALDADDHMVLASDTAGFLETAVGAGPDEGDLEESLEAVGKLLGEPVSAAIYSGDYACAALAMGQADPDDQAQAAELVEAAGVVDPYRAFAMGAAPNGDVIVGMEFADAGQAQANADSRAVLATGPAVGQGGDFSERFSLRSARADGSTVTLTLRPADGQYVLSDLSSGPVLFATC